MFKTPSPTRRDLVRGAAVVVLASAALSVAAAASAHGFSSTVYADATETAPGAVSVELDLEYDLLVVSAAENESDPDFFEDGMALFETGEEATALEEYSTTVQDYVTERFTVAADGLACVPSPPSGYESHIRDDVPYALFTLDYACETDREDPDYEIRSRLFPDAEGYVTGTTTVLEFDLGGESGSAALGSDSTFSTAQPLGERLLEFFLLGAEHLLSGIDHILFLLALIVGSRRLRDVVLAATAFTVAHSITFLLAALGLVTIPASIVEPVIAMSIAIVGAWYLWTVWRRRGHEFDPVPVPRGLWGLNRADWLRLAVVFAFGLVHGLGFASALGIDEPWSMTLLWSLVVFNLGIEFTQLAIIIIVFPLLLLLRRRAPRVGLWVGVAVAVVVTVFGLIWFVERVLGLG
ncbi:hydrogenase/urease accessory protein HupE [Leifsonia sp. AK011]|uniref:HupE/UreJ family protein n=1 Tax=Leifsonia sp. AK011 TaxID=2723075 RepID=UPI0015CBD35A|nr:HupE/UreJ family protein [Leifsonia sp. AK011]NYF10016.1 hydrogenase/urease accessory protein HupE [Leifsonia sp. AK011]